MVIKNKCIIETIDNFRPLNSVFKDFDSSIFQSPPNVLFQKKFLEMEHFLLIKSPKDFYWDLYSGKYKSSIEPKVSSVEYLIMTPRISFSEFLFRCENLKEFYSIYFMKQFRKNILDNPKESNMRYIGDLRTFEFKNQSLYEFYLDLYSRNDTVLIRYDNEEDIKILEESLGEKVDFSKANSRLFDLEPTDDELKLIEKLYGNLTRELKYDNL
jgi:hypothetical protein